MSSTIKNGSLSALNGQRSQQEVNKLKAEKSVVDYFAKDSDASADRIDTLKDKLRSKDHSVRDTNRENLHWTEHGIVERDGKKVDLLLRDLKLEFNPLSGVWAKIKEFFSWIASFFTSNTNVMPNNLLRVLDARPEIRAEFESKFSALKSDAKALKAIYDILNVYANLPKEVKIDISEQLQLVASYLNVDISKNPESGEAVKPEEVVGILLAKFEERSKELEQFFKGTEVDLASAWQSIADDKEFNSEVGNAFVDQIRQYNPHKPGDLPKAMLVSKPNEFVVVEFCAEGGLYSGVEGARSEYYAQTMTLLADSLNEVVEKFKNVKLEELSFELKPEFKEQPLTSAEKKLNEKYKAHQKNVAAFGVDLKNAYLQELLNSVAKAVFMVDTGENLSTLNGEFEGSAKSKISELVLSAESALNLEVKLFALNFNGRSKNLDQFNRVKSNVCVAPKYELRLQDMSSSQAQMKGYNSFTSDLAVKMNNLVNTRYKNLKDYNTEAFAKLVHKTLELGEMLEKVTVPEHKEQLSTVVENQVDYIVRTSTNPVSAQKKLEELKENIQEISKKVAGYSKKLVDVAAANGKLGKVFERLVLDEIWRIISSKNSKSADKLDDIKDIKTKLDAFGKAFGLDDVFGVSGFAQEVTEIHAEIAKIRKKAPYMLEAISEKSSEAEPKDVDDESEEGSTEATSANKDKAIASSSEYSAKFYVKGEFEGKEVVGLEDYLLRKAVVATEKAFYDLRGLSSKPFSTSEVSQVKEFAKNITAAAAQIAEIKEVDEDLFKRAQSDIKWGGVVAQFEKPASELPNSTLLNHTVTEYVAIAKEVDLMRKQLKSSLTKATFEHEYEILKNGNSHGRVGWFGQLEDSRNYIDEQTEPSVQGEQKEWIGLNMNLKPVKDRLVAYNARLANLGSVIKGLKKYEDNSDPISKKIVLISKQMADNLVDHLLTTSNVNSFKENLVTLNKALMDLESTIDEIYNMVNSTGIFTRTMSAPIKEKVDAFIAEQIWVYGIGLDGKNAGGPMSAQNLASSTKLLREQMKTAFGPLLKAIRSIDADMSSMKSNKAKSAVMEALSKVIPATQLASKSALDSVRCCEVLADSMKFITKFDKLANMIHKDDSHMLEHLRVYGDALADGIVAQQDLSKIVAGFESKFSENYSDVVSHYESLQKKVTTFLLSQPTENTRTLWADKFKKITDTKEKSISLAEKNGAIEAMLEVLEVKEEAVAENDMKMISSKIKELELLIYENKTLEPVSSKISVALNSEKQRVYESESPEIYEGFLVQLKMIEFAIKFKDQKVIVQEIVNPIATMVDPATTRKRDLFSTKANWKNVYEVFADFRREQNTDRNYVAIDRR